MENISEDVVFIGTPAKHGDYYIFHIPNKLMKANVIDPDKTYKVNLSPLKQVPKTPKIDEKEE